jgi:hypothetical protein
MNLRANLAALTLLLVLSACGQSTPNPSTSPSSSGKNHLGLIEVTFSGLGTKNFIASAKNISNKNTQSRIITDIADGIQLVSVSKGSFDVGTRGVDGVRYLSATFKVRNAEASCTPTPCSPTAYGVSRQNLSFIAVSAGAPLAPTINQTAVSNLTLFNGAGANPSLAQSILPTHGMDFDRLTLQPKIGLGGEDFQAFKESEVSSLAAVLSPFGVTSVFPYGFVARCVSNCTANTRNLPANPAANQFDGSVTFAAKVPLQTTSAADPFSFSLLFEIVDDSTTRVTQSLEEQSTPSLATARAAALTGAQVFKLPGVVAPSTCSVRTAGTVATPAAFLINSVGVSTPSLANQMFVANNATVTTSFGQLMNPATPSNFVVQGSMTGQKTGLYGALVNDLTFAPTSLSRPGEELEVTLTNSISSVAGLSLCPNYTFRYRTAVANPSAGTFATAVGIGGGQAYNVALGDVNNDGNLDSISANFDTHSVSVRLGAGNGTFAGALDFDTGNFNAPYGITVGDVNNDGSLDILTANKFSSQVSVMRGNGDGTFQAVSNYSTGSLTQPNAVVVGDLNSDGKLDVVTANPTSNTVSVLYGSANGTLQTAVQYATHNFPQIVELGDLNSDGKLDLVSSNYSSNDLSVLLAKDDGTFQTAVNYATQNFPYAVTVADVNNDQKLDLISANSYSGSVSVLLGIGDGTFQAAVNFQTGNLVNAGVTPFAVKTADVNGDGKLDLLTANYTSSDVSVLLGVGDGTFQTPSTYSASSFRSRALAVGDINNDGKLDVMTANVIEVPAGNDLAILLQP